MLTRYSATKGEISEMIKLLKNNKPHDIDYVWDSEDELGFVSAKIGNVNISFQDRGYPCFIEFTIGRDCYGAGKPTGELLELLVKITNDAKEKRKWGKTFAEKIKV